MAPIPAIGAWLALQTRNLPINRQVKAIFAAIICGGAYVATIVKQGNIYWALTGAIPGDSAYMLALILLEGASALAVGFFIAYRMREREKRAAQARQ
ncbi:MAG: hypothetical protein ACRD5K_15420 [Candidatus Acidiferrales bacterium]